MGIPQDVSFPIPGSAWEAIALPEHRKEDALRCELALTLYREHMLSFGKARELAGMEKYDFGRLLGERRIERHYGSEELAEDLAFAHADAE